MGFNSPSPEWTGIDLTALPNWAGGNLIAFVVDAFSPKYLPPYQGAVNGWLLTSEGVQRVTDMFGTLTLSPPSPLHASCSKRMMQFERGVQNWGIVVSGYGDNFTILPMRAAYTTDGLNWTEAIVPAASDTSSVLPPALVMNPHRSGHALLFHMTGTDHGLLDTCGCWETTNYGATWTQITNPRSTISAPTPIVVPFSDSTFSTFYYRYGRTAFGDTWGFRRVLNDIDADITPVIDGITYLPLFAQYPRAISICDANPNVLVAICEGGVNSGGNFNVLHTGAVLMSRNATAATPGWHLITQSSDYRAVYVTAPDFAFLMGTNNAIGVLDRMRLIDKRGNLTSEPLSTFAGIAGGG